jgi:hypothetical protein
MRKGTFFADLIALFIVSAISAALSAQHIQRAIAEQTVELRFIDPFVTGEISAFPILEKLMMHVLIFCVHA